MSSAKTRLNASLMEMASVSTGYKLIVLAIVLPACSAVTYENRRTTYHPSIKYTSAIDSLILAS
jgi:hypothetical protein